MANYLSYTKTILAKMSFDAKLLNKEYRKSLKLLSAQEIMKLNNWIRKQSFAMAVLHNTQHTKFR